LILSTDVGSLFPRIDVKDLNEGAHNVNSFSSLIYKNQSLDTFENEIVSSFIDKINAGLDMPTYPQFRDMNEMFLSSISKRITIIPELEILRQNLSKIKDKTKLDKVPIRVCVTGPYTLGNTIEGANQSINDISDHLCKILEKSLFKLNSGEVKLVCIDEPVFGFLGDAKLDYGSQGREVLRKAWENIYKIVTSRGIETSIHLHNTSDKLFWDVKNLNIIESHVDDSIYQLESTKKNLEETDKFLKASIGITRFDNLIMSKVGENPEDVAKSWDNIRKKKTQPEIFLEDNTIIEKRLLKIIDHFGSERIPYAGPECGVNGFPSYDCGIEYLKRISQVVHNKNVSD
jgi:5-methyltetrahydropteroyltriglutamate--homocysteine methyltransferase